MEQIGPLNEGDAREPLAEGMHLEHGEVVPHPTVEERVTRGKTARHEVPRSAHADIGIGPDRADPVALLERQATSRVPELVPIRYGRMLVSPFTFYRGAALIMAADLANTPRSGIATQICGDAHLMNFGAFASPERRLVFDINDFDETLPGPWEWDVKRLAVSFAIAGRENGFSAKQREKVQLALVGDYRAAMHRFAAMRTLDVWSAHIDAETIVGELHKADRRRAQTQMAKARTRDSLQAFDKLTHIIDGEPRFVSDPPLIEPVEELVDGADHGDVSEFLRNMLRTYRRTLQTDRRHLLEEFRVVDMARKVVGVGSVGTKAWIILLFGRDGNDPLILQAKEAQPSVLEEFLEPSRDPTHGARVVRGQHLMQASSDIFLGWDRVSGFDGIERDFYIRQLRDWKGAIPVAHMTPADMATFGGVCGTTLARAHARSGDRIAIASYLGSSDSFDRAIAEFSEAYADQSERDHDALARAERDGRITVKHGL